MIIYIHILFLKVNWRAVLPVHKYVETIFSCVSWYPCISTDINMNINTNINTNINVIIVICLCFRLCPIINDLQL